MSTLSDFMVEYNSTTDYATLGHFTAPSLAKIVLESDLNQLKLSSKLKLRVEGSINPQPIKKKVSKVKECDLVTHLLKIAPKDDVRQYINGVCIEHENNRAIVTDGAYLIKLDNADLSNFQKPKPEENRNYIINKNYEFISGVYPDYHRVIPKDIKSIEVDVNNLYAYVSGCLKAYSYFSVDYHSKRFLGAIRLVVGDGEIVLQLHILKNVLEFLLKSGHSTAQMGMSKHLVGAYGPLVFRSSNVDCVMMPMTIKDEPTFQYVINAQ